MAVVVSDTTPLHYLILVGQESILQKLYGNLLYLNDVVRLGRHGWVMAFQPPFS